MENSLSFEELGEGLIQPILVKGNMGLFQLTDGTFAMLKKGKGIIKKLDGEPSQEFINELIAKGFKDPF